MDLVEEEVDKSSKIFSHTAGRGSVTAIGRTYWATRGTTNEGTRFIFLAQKSLLCTDVRRTESC